MLKSKRKLVVLGFAVVLVLGIGLCFYNIRNAENNDMEEFDEEQMASFFDEYKNMCKNGQRENILTVVGDGKLEEYGAVDVVEGPNRTYFLMYDSMEARDEAYARFETNDSFVVDKNVEMHLMGHDSWGIEAMGLDNAIGTIADEKEKIKVAIIDTGLDVKLFQSHYPNRELITYDIETGSDDFDDMVDYTGHGTHVTGIVADGTPNNVSIMAMRTSKGEEDLVYASDVTMLVYKAISDGAKVINVSLGAYEEVVSQKLALNYAKKMGVVTIAAAGNDEKSETMYPAGYDSTISVSAVFPDLSFASFSNYGETIDFAAPGVNIMSLNGIQHGTSMATPHVAAAVAILKSFNVDLSFDDAKQLLIEHAQDLGEPGWDQQFGYGFIDLKDAKFCDGVHCDEFGVFASEGIAMQIENKTAGAAVVEEKENGIKVTAERACIVLTSNDDGETYERVPAMAIEGEDNAYMFEFETFDQMQVVVALKGDVNMNGAVNARDAAAINYYLLSESNPNHRDLTALEVLVADVNNSKTITARDVSLINYVILSTGNANYRNFEW